MYIHTGVCHFATKLSHIITSSLVSSRRLNRQRLLANIISHPLCIVLVPNGLLQNTIPAPIMAMYAHDKSGSNKT